MKTRNIMLIVFGILTIGVVVLLILSIPEDAPLHREEAGFLEGAPTWEQGQLPLVVYATTYRASEFSEHGELVPPDSDDLDTVKDVISVVNRRLGFTAFRLAVVPSHDILNPEVPLVLGAPVEVGVGGAGGHAQIRLFGITADDCEIETRNTGTSELLWLTLYHEFGHCLGLAHDDFEQSIMRPVQSPTPDGVIPPWFSDHDRRIIRERYMR